MDDFFAQNHLADCVILFPRLELVSGKSNVLPAHKIVLAAGSEFFRQQFRPNSDTDAISVNHVDDTHMRAVVQFMYAPHTFQIWPRQAQVIINRLDLAITFRIPRLIEQCVNTLIDDFAAATTAILRSSEQSFSDTTREMLEKRLLGREESWLHKRIQDNRSKIRARCAVLVPEVDRCDNASR